MKIERLVPDVTAVGFPDRGECDILGMFLDIFWPILATVVDGEAHCDVGISS